MSVGTSRRNRNRSDLPINAEINVTSLVDVAFTLLIIFIITAPILQGGIEVAIPQADVQPLTSQDEPFFVTITAENEIFMENTLVTAEEFETSLAQMVSNGVERIYIRADSVANWGPVMRAMATTQNSGVAWSVVGEPAPNR